MKHPVFFTQTKKDYAFESYDSDDTNIVVPVIRTQSALGVWNLQNFLIF